MLPRTVFHIDMDAFFASVEQRDNPQYRDRPLIVGARPGTRGVVSASSYEARKFGVRSAMPISEAVRRCPQGIFVTPRMDAYERDSRAVMEILSRFSPLLEQVSVDEAFLDMTGTEKLFGTAREAGERIAGTIESELRLTASIGIAPNKFLAKIASDLNKPRGITLAPSSPQAIAAWLAPLSAGRIWGVGKKTAEALAGRNIRTVADIQACTRAALTAWFGANGESLFELCRGIDERPVEESGSVQSISREHTFNRDSYDREEWKRTLFHLAQDVARRSRQRGVKGRTVVLTWRCIDFSRHSKRLTLPFPTNLAKPIYEAAAALLEQVPQNALRLIGAGLTALDQEIQTDLFAEERSVIALEKAETAADFIARKFGDTVIGKGREMGRGKKKI